MTSIKYNATTTASRFHCDSSRVRLLFGPVGCGKSVASCIEVFRRACEQEPGSDGIRRSRWAIIRNTYPELKTTTIKTWQQWFPEELFGPIRWDSPITHHIKIDDIDAEIIFIALDGSNDIKKLMSLELTGAYINEMQFIPKAVFDICQQRINRYPSKITGAEISWAGLIADTNPPDNEHWIYKLFEENKPDDYKIFKYEPALKVITNPLSDYDYKCSLDGTYYVNNYTADYRICQNDPNYWINLVSGYKDEQIKVFLQGEYGVWVDGKPVHPEYNDTIHCAKSPIIYNPDVETGLGWDFGLTPACAVVQLLPNGQLAVLAELYSDDMSLRDFAEYSVIPYCNQHFSGWSENYISRHDPAGEVGSQTDGKSCQQILSDLNINSATAAKSNAPTARRDGLKYFLRRLVGGSPGFVINQKCTRLRKALMGNFNYARIKTSVNNNYHEKPEKNLYSHITEALEYIAMHYARNPVGSTINVNNLIDRSTSFWSR